jgi:hypothetical protein
MSCQMVVQKWVEQCNTTFPQKLHILLEHAEKNGSGDIISWLPDGKSFKVHKKQAFTAQILPAFFGTSKYKSFQRNLNLWGIKAVWKGPSKGARSHPSFRRGIPELCLGMVRVSIKGTGPKRAKTDYTVSPPRESDQTDDWLGQVSCSTPALLSNSSGAISCGTNTASLGGIEFLRNSRIRENSARLRDLTRNDNPFIDALAELLVLSSRGTHSGTGTTYRRHQLLLSLVPPGGSSFYDSKALQWR